MKFTLYHSVESTCSQKVRIVLSTKGLQWEQVNLNLRKGEQFSPDYLKLNPKAVVPTLIHEEKVIRESTVIINYLEDLNTGPSMRPNDAYERAKMNLIIKTFDEEVHPSVGILSYAIVLRHQMNELKTPEQLKQHFASIVDPMRRQRQESTHENGLLAPSAGQAFSTLAKVTALMQEMKGNNDWLCGEVFSLADAAAIPYMLRIKNLGLESLWSEQPGLQDWMDKTIARVDSYGLSDAWGSRGFHEMVGNYVEKSKTEIENLIGNAGL